MAAVPIVYFSDILCIWAYAAQRRIEKLVETFGDKIVIETRYCSVFPNAWPKIEGKWGKEDGFDKFAAHLAEVAGQFPHIELNADVWRKTRPRSSVSGHLFLKAVELVAEDRGEEGATPFPDRLSTRAAWQLRKSFFAAAKDIGAWRTHREIADELGVDYAQVEEKIRSSEAVVAVIADYDLAQRNGVEGSPTFLMNEGRQKLFGNVGYRLLEANVEELLHQRSPDEASWC